jgi:hypothetical protein
VIDQLERVPESTTRAAIGAACDAWLGLLGDGLQSLVLFGSQARGEAGPTSDIDLLVVADGLPRSLAERRRPLLAAWEQVRAQKNLGSVVWNLIVKSPQEARVRSALYLDLVEDALLLYDRDHFFADVLEGLRQRMRELGSRRIYLPDGSWYWDLKPNYRFGEVVEL